MKIRGLCKRCTHSYTYYGNKDSNGKRIATGVWCVSRNGKVRNPPKKCNMFNMKGE